jgi:hypothetical protein
MPRFCDHGTQVSRLRRGRWVRLLAGEILGKFGFGKFLGRGSQVRRLFCRDYLKFIERENSVIMNIGREETKTIRHAISSWKLSLMHEGASDDRDSTWPRGRTRHHFTLF